MIKHLLRKVFIVSSFLFLFSCSSNDEKSSYEDNVNRITKNFIAQKTILLSEIIQEKHNDSIVSSKKLVELNKLEAEYENSLNQLNENLSEKSFINTFEINKTTELNISQYGVQLDLSIKKQTVFNWLIKEIINFIIKVIVLGLIIFLLSRLGNYIVGIDLFKKLISHRYIFIVFLIICFFLSPAKYFGLLLSNEDSEIEKIVTLNVENTVKHIEETKDKNVNKIEE